VEWKNLPWKKIERVVFKLQKRIYKASSRGDTKAVRRLQKTLMKSWYAKLLSVRRVTQDNQGKKTAGVDGVKSPTPAARLRLAKELKLGTKVKPTRRVWIPKPGKDEKRPLGIPTMNDRALQALSKLALEPEWEARFEPNSYGFRPGRSCHDAIEAIFISINRKPKYVLDADIAKCFDRINHEALLTKLNTFPTIRRQIRAWLKAGVMDGKAVVPTLEGTPQGGVISPLLANIALHGLEEVLKQYVETLPLRYPSNRIMAARDKRVSLNVLRYADDFVIFHEDLTVVQKCREITSEWLKGMGLELKPSKTRLAHTLIQYEQEKPGFNFLGFKVQQYAVGTYHSKQGFKTFITPSKEKVKIHHDQIAEVIKDHKAVSQAALIKHINPIIRGWANYYSTVVSKETYSSLDNLMYQKLAAWAKRRHPRKPWKWIKNKYWQTVGGNNWVFATRQEGKNPLRLINHAVTPIVRHVKVKGESSPYDGNLVYWSIRLGKNPELSNKVTKTLKQQKGKCTHCEVHFKTDDVWEIDHIIPKSQGGKDKYKNLQLLHRHCHDKKTELDNSLGNKSGCNRAKPKTASQPKLATDAQP